MPVNAGVKFMTYSLLRLDDRYGCPAVLGSSGSRAGFSEEARTRALRLQLWLSWLLSGQLCD